MKSNAWTEEETRILTDAVRSGTVCGVMTVLQRTPQAIESKALRIRRRLGLVDKERDRKPAFLALAREGKTKTEIARALKCSPNTVERMKRELGVSLPSRADKIRAWTDEEIAVLKTCATTMSQQEAVAFMKRTKHQIILQSEKLGIKWRQWTEDDLAVLTDMAKQGFTAADIADRLPGRSLSGVRHKAATLGLVLSNKPRRQPQGGGLWTGERLENLTELWRQGMSATQCARILGTTKGSVMGAVHRHKLVQGERPPARQWSEELTAKAVKLAGEQVDILEISRQVGRSVKAVRGKLRSLDRKSPGEQTRQTYARRNRAYIWDLEWGVNKCSFPLGDPGRPGFRFCGGDSVSEKPYCSEHMDVAYSRWGK